MHRALAQVPTAPRYCMHYSNNTQKHNTMLNTTRLSQDITHLTEQCRLIQLSSSY